MAMIIMFPKLNNKHEAGGWDPLFLDQPNCLSELPAAFRNAMALHVSKLQE
jgi:hypothetical protein